MALYIYWVGGLVPQEILLQDLNLRKLQVVLGLCLDWSDRSDPPIRLFGRAKPVTGNPTVRPRALGLPTGTESSKIRDRAWPILYLSVTTRIAVGLVDVQGNYPTMME